jgi:hypothetical protein
VDLKHLPANTCPLCRQAALDQSTDQWTCDFCGCKLDFDPASRRTRIAYWPAQYAALKAGVGSDWLSRRELFERIDVAAAAAPPERAPKMIGPLLIIAAALLLLCAMLSAVASAIVISPSIARTRRVISQAYLPTATAAITATATTMQSAQATLPAGQPMEQPAVTSPLSSTPLPSPAGQAVTPAAFVTTPTPMPTPELPTPAAQQVTEPQPQTPPTQPPALPPTFTPVPPTLAVVATQPPALPGAQTSPLPPPQATPAQPGQPAPPTPAATFTPTVTPTIAPTPTVSNTQPQQPLQPGSQVLAGTVRIVTVFANGNTALNEADEYVELRNEGQTPAYLDGWRLKAIRNADNAQLDEYTFPGGSVIAANQTCRIYTNLPFGAENCGFAGGFANDQPIWPPNGARAVLVNPQGQEMARFVY